VGLSSSVADGEKITSRLIGLGAALATGPVDCGVADGSLDFAEAVVSTEIERTKQVITMIWIRIENSASRLSASAIFRTGLFILHSRPDRIHACSHSAGRVCGCSDNQNP
jgi:hypothetical protein